MAIAIDNEFSSYELTDEEAIQGAIFTITQKQVLQNQLAMLAGEKLALEFDVNKPNKFIQDDSFKKGQIDLIKYLLDCSIVAEEQLKYQATQQPE